MPKSEEEIKQEQYIAQIKSDFDNQKRRLYFAKAEADLVQAEAKSGAAATLASIVQKYGITRDDTIVLVESSRLL